MFTPGFPVNMIPARTEQGKIFLEAAQTVAKYPVGTRLRDNVGREYVYSITKTNDSIAAGDICLLSDGATHDGALPLTSALAAENVLNGCPVGIAMVAVTAIASTQQYCWFCIYADAQNPASAPTDGTVCTAMCKVTSSSAAEGALATATSTGAIEILGLALLTGATATSAAKVVNDSAILNYPRMASSQDT